MPRYCHNRPLGTTPNAKIRIPTPYAAATRGPVPKIGCKDVAKCTHAALAPLRLGFSLILGLVVHNMSAPPRTEVRAEKRGIADRIVVFSLVYALTVRGFLEKHERPEKLPNGRDFEEIPLNYSSDERSTIRLRWPSPGDLFAQNRRAQASPNNGRFPHRLASRHLD